MNRRRLFYLGVLVAGFTQLTLLPSRAIEPVGIQAEILELKAGGFDRAVGMLGGKSGVLSSPTRIDKLKQELRPTVRLLPDLKAAPGLPVVVKDLERCVVPENPKGVVRREKGKDVFVCLPESTALEDVGVWFAAAAKPEGNQVQLEWSFRHRRAEWVDQTITVKYPDGVERQSPWRTAVFDGCAASERRRLGKNEISYSVVKLEPKSTQAPEQVFLILVRAE